MCVCDTNEILLTQFKYIKTKSFLMTFWSPADGNLSKFGEGVEKSLHSVTGLIGIPKQHCLNSFVRVNVEHFN